MNKKYRIIYGPESIQGSPEWLSFRQGKIGASDVASIIGISPWETKLQCFDRFVTGVQKPKNAAMERGSRLEEPARKWLNEKLGTSYRPAVVQSISHPDIIASLDGYFEDHLGNPYICEIKCGGHKSHLEAINGQVPKHYLPQLMHQMDLVGVDRMLYVSFDGTDGVVLEVRRDEEYCFNIFTEILAFLSSVLKVNAPEPDNQDWVTETDYSLVEKAIRADCISKMIVNLSDELDSLKSELTAFCKHPRTIVGPIKLQKVKRIGNIDYPRYIKDNNLNIPDEYRKESSENWRITPNH